LFEIRCKFFFPVSLSQPINLSLQFSLQATTAKPRQAKGLCLEKAIYLIKVSPYKLAVA